MNNHRYNYLLAESGSKNYDEALLYLVYERAILVAAYGFNTKGVLSSAPGKEFK